MSNPVEKLREAGLSVWLDYISRGLIASGELERMVRDGWITGVTSNPTIFRRSIAESSDYDEQIKMLAGRDLSAYDAYLEVCGKDIRLASDILRPVYDQTAGADGFVSFEAQAGTTEAMIEEAKRMFAFVDRPNVMIKIPGVPEGVEAVEALITQGINVNITLLFDVEVYERFAEAYLRAMESRLEAGQQLNVSSVASFFVSRVDTKVDKLLPTNSKLRGKVAVANARRAYGRFQQVFTEERWQRLAKAGARVQRPLWGSTGTKDPSYSDVLYVEELVAPQTVNTMPEATLQAFLDHGHVRPAVLEGLDDSDEVLRQAAVAGIDMHAITRELLDEGLYAFGSDLEGLLAEIGKALGRIDST